MEHKIIVIGAGVGGLTAAALLAKRGFDVTVLEAHVRAGRLRGDVLPQGLSLRRGRDARRRISSRRAASDRRGAAGHRVAHPAGGAGDAGPFARSHHHALERCRSLA